jgi:ribosomal protein S12 methylthiotransferase accessory factor
MVKQRMKAMDLKILDQTTRIDNGRLDIPVFFSTCGHDARAVIGTKKQMGKGATPAQAEASAVMELAERFSFFSFYRNPDHTRLGTFDQFADEAITFDQIARSVHDESGDRDVSKQIFESLPLRWTGAWSLTREKEVLVPLDWFYAINAFNGPSAGNCVEEALSQGICEIVERHVSSLISRQHISTSTDRPVLGNRPAGPGNAGQICQSGHPGDHHRFYPGHGHPLRRRSGLRSGHVSRTRVKSSGPPAPPLVRKKP